MATIKAIESRSVHQIQSGQVIVDLCSVAKELVENSLDAGATSIEVRFKNHGLESIEVQDNGGGIAPEDYATIALKHHTSKLSDYSDLGTLNTFGFRGEALSSLCALSNFHIITARQDEAPKGTRLDFETSGKLKGTQVVASQRGTTVVVEHLFQNLPVRRRELEKNIKREYGKVLALLHAYACISTGIKFVTSNQMVKGKKAVVFGTKSNGSTKENIANVFGAKTLTALASLDLKLDMKNTASGQKWSNRRTERSSSQEIHVMGHISRPVFGEGRQTPDRQMFFVNGRPCGLPQIAKAFNEVYKSYNIAQSPFIFADFIMDTNSYDVNVSPDKRTILLHDQNALLETLKASLTELFDAQDQTVPQSQLFQPRQQTLGRPTLMGRPSLGKDNSTPDAPAQFVENQEDDAAGSNQSLEPDSGESGDEASSTGKAAEQEFKIGPRVLRTSLSQDSNAGYVNRENLQNDSQRSGKDVVEEARSESPDHDVPNTSIPIRDFNSRLAEQEKVVAPQESGEPSREHQGDPTIPAIGPSTLRSNPGVVQNAFDRMRPKRAAPETATITIGSKTTVSPILTSSAKRHKQWPTSLDRDQSPTRSGKASRKLPSSQKFAKSLRAFSAPSTKQNHMQDDGELTSEESDESIPEGEAQATRPLSHSSPKAHSEAFTELDEAEEHTPEGLSEDETNTEIPTSHDDEEQSDEEYVDEADRKVKDEILVQQLIKQAETGGSDFDHAGMRRATNLFTGGSARPNAMVNLLQRIETSVLNIEQHVKQSSASLRRFRHSLGEDGTILDAEVASPEEKLSLTILKDDFARMRVIGQFNLGFILAVRSPPVDVGTPEEGVAFNDELFIVDQHASDEKYNFERLQAQTLVQNQRLVRPRPLELTAIEEEIIMSHAEALVQNGFVVEVDDSGDEAVGHRCRLLSLPMSREVTFSVRDLEELISLLSEWSSSAIPRPSRVRSMFAMRACRSSVMVGRTLSSKQMHQIVRHMGEIDKPWNCPHGRPTMRHLLALDTWESWDGDGALGSSSGKQTTINWSRYISGAV
ncbi:MAG: hypothetical protein M4579_001678 [Chaenotheca gracillima]|nr:MAG: hypothetical protein M4579_001678 [Chaenotheca gracillima]